MNAFLRRFFMHHSVYRRYPLGPFKRTHVTSPPPQSHYFLAKAAECLDRSLAVPDREYQRLYCELAGQWLILAQETDTKNNQKFCGAATANK
jgi:hypothetical protein